MQRSAMIDYIDHVVLTTGDLQRCLDFYTRVLGMTVEHYGKGRIAKVYLSANTSKNSREIIEELQEFVGR